MRAVGADSSWVVGGNGGAVRVRPARRVDGRPEGRVPPGTPGDPSRRASSQGAAQQRILPLLERAVHVGGPHARGTTPGRGSRPAGPGRAVVDGSPMMPVPGRSWGRHARENPGKDLGGPRPADLSEPRVRDPGRGHGGAWTGLPTPRRPGAGLRTGSGTGVLRAATGRAGPVDVVPRVRSTPATTSQPTASVSSAGAAGVTPGRRRGRPPGGGRPLRVVRVVHHPASAGCRVT